MGIIFFGPYTMPKFEEKLFCALVLMISVHMSLGLNKFFSQFRHSVWAIKNLFHMERFSETPSTS